jgi:hypothetical protein
MAESFFIRKTVNIDNDNAFHEGVIDLGAYVDALSSSVLTIHRVDVAFTDSTGRSLSMVAADTAAVAQFQLTTQTHNDIVRLDDRSVIASGKIEAYTPSIASSPLAATSTTAFDIAPQLFTNGYTVATENIYLGGSANTNFAGNVYCSIMIECTVTKMTQAKAMSLALSQQ